MLSSALGWSVVNSASVWGCAKRKLLGFTQSEHQSSGSLPFLGAAHLTYLLRSPRTGTVPKLVNGWTLLLGRRSWKESCCQEEAWQPAQGLDQDPQEVVVRPSVQRVSKRRRKAGSGKGGRPHCAAGQCQKCHFIAPCFFFSATCNAWPLTWVAGCSWKSWKRPPSSHLQPLSSPRFATGSSTHGAASSQRSSGGRGTTHRGSPSAGEERSQDQAAPRWPRWPTPGGTWGAGTTSTSSRSPCTKARTPERTVRTISTMTRRRLSWNWRYATWYFCSLVIWLTWLSLQSLSKQRYDSGESGVYSSSSCCPCGCGKESSSHSEDNSAPTSLYISSSYITNKLCELASSPLPPTSNHPAFKDSRLARPPSPLSEELPLDMSRTSSSFPSSSNLPLATQASQRELFPGLFLLVDTALESESRRMLTRPALA